MRRAVRRCGVAKLVPMWPVKEFRNTIFNAVVAGELDARECTFDYDDAKARITHVPSGSSFLIEHGQTSSYLTTAFVGDLSPFQLEAAIWPTVEERVERWARDVKRDVDTPDLWAEVQAEREIFTGDSFVDDDNSSFSQDEQAEIVEQVRVIKVFVQTSHVHDDAQWRSIEAKLDYIQEAAGRIGRKDWWLLVLGVMFELIATGLLPPNAVRDIITAAFHALGHLFKMPPPMLPPSF